MKHRLLIKISAVLLLGIISIVGIYVEITVPVATPIVVAQKQDTCDNFKVLSPIGQIDIDASIYFSWTVVDEADEYILVIVNGKGNVVDKLHISSDQTWVYYTLGSIQINTQLNYKIYAQKKDVLLCSTLFEPIDPWTARLTGTPIPPTPTSYLMRNQDDKKYTVNIFTTTPIPYPTATPPVLYKVDDN